MEKLTNNQVLQQQNYPRKQKSEETEMAISSVSKVEFI